MIVPVIGELLSCSSIHHIGQVTNQCRAAIACCGPGFWYVGLVSATLWLFDMAFLKLTETGDDETVSQ